MIIGHSEYFYTEPQYIVSPWDTCPFLKVQFQKGRKKKTRGMGEDLNPGTPSLYT